MVIAHHIVISGYGTWFSNDLRGSGSEETRKKELDELGPVHTGRKLIQPSKNEMREFFREAEARLDFPVLWFNEAQRRAIADGFAKLSTRIGTLSVHAPSVKIMCICAFEGTETLTM